MTPEEIQALFDTRDALKQQLRKVNEDLESRVS